MTDPPFNAIAIARRLGVEVVLVSNPGWSGACQIGDKAAKLFLNFEDSKEKQNFTAAYQLAHILHHKIGYEYRDWVDPGSTDMSRTAKQARAFAFDLTMPEWSIRVTVDVLSKSKGFIKPLAKLYEVTEVAMDYRLRTLYC